MGYFFKGWRRKIGVMTLVMACVLMVGWGRSVVIEDSVTAACEGFITVFVASKSQGLVWAKLQETKGSIEHPLFRGHSLGWASRKNSAGPFDGIDGYSSQRRWHWCGFRFEDGELELPVKIRLTIRVVPYWSVILPLTFISAFLLVHSKPTKSIQKKTAEAIPETVA